MFILFLFKTVHRDIYCLQLLFGKQILATFNARNFFENGKSRNFHNFFFPQQFLDIKYAALKPNTYSYLAVDNDENKDVKATKKSVKKRKLEDYKNCLETNQLEKK